MAKPRFIKSRLFLLLYPMLMAGMTANEAPAQTKPTKLQSILVLEHGAPSGYRASCDDLNAALRELGTTHGFAVKVLAQSALLEVEFSAENLAKYQAVILAYRLCNSFSVKVLIGLDGGGFSWHGQVDSTDHPLFMDLLQHRRHQPQA